MSGVSIALIIFASGFAILFAGIGILLIALAIVALREAEEEKSSEEMTAREGI